MAYEGGCFTDDDIWRISVGQLDSVEDVLVTEHLKEFKKCQDKLVENAQRLVYGSTEADQVIDEEALSRRYQENERQFEEEPPDDSDGDEDVDDFWPEELDDEKDDEDFDGPGE